MNNKHWDALWMNGNLATMSDKEMGLLKNAAIAVKNKKIAWIGSMADLKKMDYSAAREHDMKGGWLTPGLIDCHTHLVYAGNRCHEFTMRLEGKSYEAIARAGGGIRSTVLATRSASFEELRHQSLKRANAMIAGGVTTIEIKSGYGLDLETELKILRVAKAIANELPLTVKTTFLGAHAVPIEYQGRPDAYIDLVCEEMLPRVAEENLADFVDVFCENIGFNLKQTERVFTAAKKYGFALKCHAEQLSDSGGAALAAFFKATSLDHLEYLSEEGVKSIAKSGAVAVLLPGAFYFLREKKLPPIDLLRQNKVPIAIATDCNPGTSPVTSLLLMLNMACTVFQLTPSEALLGVTHHAAKALGMSETHGTLEVGKMADFALWDVGHPDELAYFIGDNPLQQRVWEGLSLASGKSVS